MYKNHDPAAISGKKIHFFFLLLMCILFVTSYSHCISKYDICHIKDINMMKHNKRSKSNSLGNPKTGMMHIKTRIFGHHCLITIPMLQTHLPNLCNQLYQLVTKHLKLCDSIK